MNQITTQNGLVGKTIEGVISDGRDLFIKFTDKSFTIIKSDSNTEGFGYTTYYAAIDKYPCDKSEVALVKLGIISEKERKEFNTQKELEDEKRHEAYRQEQLEREKAYELEKYKELSKKYGDLGFWEKVKL